jgi:DNA polymerase-3 subunit epsilon
VLNELLRLTRPLIVFDLETTAVDPQQARILQFGMEVHKPNLPVASYHTLVNPLVPIPKGASDTHGITEDVIRSGCARCKAPESSHPYVICDRWRAVPTWRDIAPNLLKGFQDADFAGYNIKSYDLPVLAIEFERVGHQFDYSSAYIVDSLVLWRILEQRTLSDAVEYFGGRKHEGAHGAIEDVIGTVHALKGQLRGDRHFEWVQKKARENRLPRTPKELHELCWPPDPNNIDMDGKIRFNADGHPCLNFGAHKDKHLADVPTSYKRWMLNGNFAADTKRIIEDALSGVYPQKNG